MKKYFVYIFHLSETHKDWFGSIAPPVYTSVNFKMETVAQLRALHAREMYEHVYSRGNNPSTELLRKKLAALENTEDALVFSSGAAAVSAAIMSCIKKEDHIVCVSHPYMWTYKFLTYLVDKMGVEVTYVPADQTEAILSACKDNTRLIYLESPNSMTFEVQDLAIVGDFARSRNIKTVIDNSHCSPLYQKPADFGIDLVVHSATKYLSGHGDTMAGVICGASEDIARIFHHEFMMFGAVLGPFEATQVVKGLRTLPLRIQRSNETAIQLAQQLEQHPAVRKVIHPLLDSFPQKSIVKNQMLGNGGLFSLILDTDEVAVCEAFVDNLEHFHLAASWGGYESLVMPMCTFKTSDDKTEGPPFNLVRLYIGLEDLGFLWKDLKQSLDNHVLKKA